MFLNCVKWCIICDEIWKYATNIDQFLDFLIKTEINRNKKSLIRLFFYISWFLKAFLF